MHAIYDTLFSSHYYLICIEDLVCARCICMICLLHFSVRGEGGGREVERIKRTQQLSMWVSRTMLSRDQVIIHTYTRVELSFDTRNTRAPLQAAIWKLLCSKNYVTRDGEWEARARQIVKRSARERESQMEINIDHAYSKQGDKFT